jgi:hypothetical protein
MGVVLKAFDPALKRLVAIKVLSPALAGSATARRRFTREAQAAAAVCHDHIVTVHGVHEVDGLPYLVMQYVAGESLQERLDRTGPLAVEEAVCIGLQAASGLAAAHAQGLIHRDIKPANLLLENGLARVKVTDFGLARTAEDVGLTQAGVVAGTPEYMAPEQARGEQVDHRADLFSLGSVLYACCTGVPPFRAPTALSVLRRVSDEAPAPVRLLNPDVPAWLEAVIARLMAKDPAERFQSAAEVAALLEGCLAHLRQPATVPAPELPRLPPGGRPGPSAPGPRTAVARPFPPRLWPLLLVPAALGAALLAWGLAGGDKAPSPRDDADPPAAQAVFHQDFRAADFDRDVLQPLDPGLERDDKGLRITLDAGPDGRHNTGFDTAFAVRGDFVITASYEVLDADRPETGYGVGVGLYAPIDPATQNAVSLSRRLIPDGTTQFASNRMTPVGGQVQHRVKTLPSTSPAGKLRLERVGPVLRYLVADGADAPFVTVDELDFGTDDLSFVRVEGNSGASQAGLNARFLDFSVRAAGLPGLPDVGPAPAQTPPRTARTGWFAAAAMIALLIALALAGGWLSKRRRHAPEAPVPGTQVGPGVHAPLVSFVCPGCGHGLKVKPELAGKKGKCPKCGDVVIVPNR